MAHFLAFPILHSYFPIASWASPEQLIGLLRYFQGDHRVRIFPEVPGGGVCCPEKRGWEETAERPSLVVSRMMKSSSPEEE